MPEEQQNEQSSEETQQTAPEAEQGQQGEQEPFDAERAKEKIRKANSEAENLRKRLKELEPLAKKAQALEDSQKSEAERLAGQLTAAEERAAKAVRTAVAAKVEALAAQGFADPEDAAGALDLSSYVTDEGDIDASAIRADLAALLKRKPHWAKPEDGPRRPAPDRTQGSSGNQQRSANDPGAEFAGFLQRALKGS